MSKKGKRCMSEGGKVSGKPPAPPTIPMNPSQVKGGGGKPMKRRMMLKK